MPRTGRGFWGIIVKATMSHKKTGTFLEYSNCVVQPGYLAVCSDPTMISVVCGNGVVVFLRDRIKKIGGVAHYIYPRTERRGRPSNYHAEVAIKSLVRCLLNAKANATNFEALLFGGGHLRGYAKKRADQTVKNSRKILRRLNIQIVSEDCGGSLGRKIVFNSYSGEVIVLKTRNIRRTDWVPELARFRQ